MNNTNPADWTDADTPESLLEAVGITVETGGTCPSGHRLFMGGEYTGPALGSEELDALLLVAGQRWCVENWHKYDDVNDAIYDSNLQAINETDTFVLEWLLFYCPTPGHALARAIREVRNG